MSSKAKKIGTRHETRVVKYLKEQTSIEDIHRRELHGNQDVGDIIIEPLNMLIEVKAGKQTTNYPRSYFDKWMGQTKVEGTNANNAGCDIEWEFLIVVQYGKAIKDAQVFEDTGLGQYNFWYLDDFAQTLKRLYTSKLGANGAKLVKKD